MKLAVSGLAEEAVGDQRLEEQAGFVVRQTQQCEEIIRTLRRIMIRGSAGTQNVDLAESLRALLPILRTQMDLSGIAFEWQIADAPVVVECNAILFQRVVFNLVANGVDALSGKQGGRLSLTLREEQGRAQIAVCDNSGLVTDYKNFNLASLAASTKPDGMGVGLVLSEMLARQWGGRLTPSLEEVGEECLTVFSLDLPMTSLQQALA